MQISWKTNRREKGSELWDSGILAKHIWGTYTGYCRVICCTCVFPVIRFSKCSFFYAAFSATLFVSVPSESPHKSDFLELDTIKFENKSDKKFKISHCGLI